MAPKRAAAADRPASVPKKPRGAAAKQKVAVDDVPPNDDVPLNIVEWASALDMPLDNVLRFTATFEKVFDDLVALSDVPSLQYSDGVVTFVEHIVQFDLTRHCVSVFDGTNLVELYHVALVPSCMQLGEMEFVHFLLPVAIGVKGHAVMMPPVEQTDDLVVKRDVIDLEVFGPLAARYKEHFLPSHFVTLLPSSTRYCFSDDAKIDKHHMWACYFATGDVIDWQTAFFETMTGMSGMQSAALHGYAELGREIGLSTDHTFYAEVLRRVGPKALSKPAAAAPNPILEQQLRITQEQLQQTRAELEKLRLASTSVPADAVQKAVDAAKQQAVKEAKKVAETAQKTIDAIKQQAAEDAQKAIDAVKKDSKKAAEAAAQKAAEAAQAAQKTFDAMKQQLADALDAEKRQAADALARAAALELQIADAAAVQKTAKRDMQAAILYDMRNDNKDLGQYINFTLKHAYMDLETDELENWQNRMDALKELQDEVRKILHVAHTVQTLETEILDSSAPSPQYELFKSRIDKHLMQAAESWDHATLLAKYKDLTVKYSDATAELNLHEHMYNRVLRSKEEQFALALKRERDVLYGGAPVVSSTTDKAWHGLLNALQRFDTVLDTDPQSMDGGKWSLLIAGRALRNLMTDAYRVAATPNITLEQIGENIILGSGKTRINLSSLQVQFLANFESPIETFFSTLSRVLFDEETFRQSTVQRRVSKFHQALLAVCGRPFCKKLVFIPDEARWHFQNVLAISKTSLATMFAQNVCIPEVGEPEYEDSISEFA